MRKHFFTLLSFLACTLLPLHAYEYFTIYFSDGTKSEAFYAVDVDSICYSKLSLDSIAYPDWQVQEIYTCDSVYRYPLTQIDSLSFKDVDENEVAEDIDRANAYIAPFYLECNDAAELSAHLSSIKNIEGVEDVWADHQALFVKIRDYGTITYIYPPAMKAGGIQFDYQMAKTRAAILETTPHHHTNIKRACIYNQTGKDEGTLFLAADSAFLEVCGMYECMGIPYDPFYSLSPEFFRNGIFDYDHIFLLTHGEYDAKKKLHWLYTSEELLCVNDENWVNSERAWLNFFMKYHVFSSDKLGIGVHKEIRNGEICVVYYTKVSERYIASSPRRFSNPGTTIVFNTACQSLKGSDTMAETFLKKGAGCYLGYTEINDIGHLGGEFFFAGMLNAQSVGRAKESIPNDYQKETWIAKKTGESIPVELKKVLSCDYDNVDNVCNIDPETLDSENRSDNGNASVTLKGRIKMVWPSLMDKFEVGFVLATNKEMNDTLHKPVIGNYDKSTRFMQFEKVLDDNSLQPNDAIFYQAYMHDGTSYCYGEVKEVTQAQAEPYVVIKDGVLTFYYDGQKINREGEVYVIKEAYSWGNFPFWSDRRDITQTFFDPSFVNYTPTSTAYWFFMLWNLSKIHNIECLNTVNVKNMREMFRNCLSLTSLDLSSFNTTNVTDMCAMFDACLSLTSLDLSSFNTANVKYMDYMFYGCSSLTSLDLSSFNTANVTDMYAMFSGCSSLTSLDLSSFNTTNVTNMGSMFSGCSSLTSLNLSSFNTANVKYMNYMFSGCSSLTSLDLSSFNTAQKTGLSEMFTNCSSLKTIYAGNWKTDSFETGSNFWMFHNCFNLVGGQGTKVGWNNGLYYCPDHGGAAHIDGGKDNPGLFTAK